MKTCFKCGEFKLLSFFYKHNAMADGHLNKCKECTKKDVMKHRSENIEKIRNYDRLRGNRQNEDYVKAWRKENPKAYKAHTMVGNALRRGFLRKKECIVCGDKKSVAHHDDYNYPLEVTWMCQSHHKQWHAKNGEGKNPK